MSTRRVLSIGQCGADHGALARTFRQHFGAEVVSASDAAEARTLLDEEHYDLILVNRILDSDGTSGMEIIKKLKGEETISAVPIMLVSNHEEAQREAMDHGAVAGFGKGSLGQPQMIARVCALLEGGSRWGDRE
jgi:two-component system chemotaxis response regulator CheY